MKVLGVSTLELVRLIMISTFCSTSLFSQISDPNWKNLIPNYRFEKQKSLFLDEYVNTCNQKIEYLFEKELIRDEKNDSILNSVRLHGVFFQFFAPVEFRSYSLGYEYSQGKNKIYFGSGAHFSIQKNSDYLDYEIGAKIFNEIGEQFGIRLGLEAHYSWIPKVLSMEVMDEIPHNTPKRQMLGISPAISIFYKTKNKYFQVLPSIQLELSTGEFFRYNDQVVVTEWITLRPIIYFGVLFKYNFKVN